jgi:signal transduction histidine kinase
VFVRLATITTVMAVTILVIIMVFMALTVNPRFGSPELNAHLRTAHFVLVGPVLLLVAGVIVIAHLRVRALLEPLKDLAEGVARLTKGDLEVVVPSSSQDEFTALTDGFNRMVGRVREMIGARDQLLRDVSHELRSPLTRFKVGLALLPEGELRSKMSADVIEMERMVAELLELERLRDGRTIEKQPVDLRPLVEDVAASFAGRQPAIETRVPADAVILDVDPRTIAMVLRNLLDNAIAYSLPDSRAVELDLIDRGTEVAVVVTDDGPGIPKDQAGRVFEPFYRIDRSRSRRTGGYGLGLSICQRIAEAHGGSVTLEPHAPRGTRFVVTLPRAEAGG